MSKLKLFGGASVVGADGVMSGRAFQRRRLGLLALLATAPMGVLSRDKLIGLLWPDSDAEQARHLLAGSVYEIRKALGEEVLLSLGDDLQLDLAKIWCDVCAFEEALRVEELERAVELYSGPFLDGFFISGAAEFERWAAVERDRLAREYAGALVQLAEGRTAAGDWRAAVEAWQRLAAHDPSSSRVALGLMQALEAVGERAGAIQYARTHAALLREEYGAQPDPAVLALERRLREDPAPLAVAADGTGAGEPAGRAGAGAASQSRPEPWSEAAGVDARTRPWRAAGIIRPPLGAIRRGAAGLLMASVAIGVVWEWRGGGVGESDGVPALAVLPFQTHGESGDEYLGDGIADELIVAFAQMQDLQVAARTSSFALVTRQATIRQIGEELRVQYVLEGSVRRAGEGLRVHAQLIDVDDGYPVWADTYRRDDGDVVGVEREISAAVLRALRREAGGETVQSPRRASPAASAAHHDYLRGRYLWSKRSDLVAREEHLRKSITYYERALAQDSTHALAYAGLADSYASLAGIVPRNEAYSRAKAAALRALGMDARLAPARLALARVLVFHEWDWKGAGREYRRALELSPNSATARHWYGMYLLHLGRVDEALQELHRALQLDPLSLDLGHDLGRAYYNARQYDRAIEQYRRTLDLDPNSAGAYLYTGLVEVERGNLGQALAAFQRWQELTDDDPRALVGYAFAASGRRAEALRAVEELTRRAAEHGSVSPVGIAAIYARLGMEDQAFRWLDRAVDARSPFVLFLKVSPRMDPLRSDPRFGALLRRIGLEP